jgi:hypothetical protein
MAHISNNISSDSGFDFEVKSTKDKKNKISRTTPLQAGQITPCQPQISIWGVVTQNNDQTQSHLILQIPIRERRP